MKNVHKYIYNVNELYEKMLLIVIFTGHQQ